MENTLTLLDLNRLLASLITVPSTQNVWVTAELSDVSVRGGHCYMELLQKDPDKGTIQARARAVIWASLYPRLNADFHEVTGHRFAAGIKVMVRASATMHPVYGLSLVINAVNPEFTMGDLLRRRREIIDRLHQEGILDMNRSLEWAQVPRNIAVVSAIGAAGYGDFINQLYNNKPRLRFKTRLFSAIMQGERAPQSIIAALDAIAQEQEAWDCVVLIRGGGATSDLAAFEDYDLAANVAQFPLPVIVGIGHERDITVLDYVANMRVKTPTAAAEWLIARGTDALERLRAIASGLQRSVTERLSGCFAQLSYLDGLIPVASKALIERKRASLQKSVLPLASMESRQLTPRLARLLRLSVEMSAIAKNVIGRERSRLDAMQNLSDVLSPQAVMRRGFSVTRLNGKAVSSVSQVSPGDKIETVFADGTIISEVEK